MDCRVKPGNDKCLRLDIIRNAGRLWHRQAVLLEPVDMKPDRVANLALDRGDGVARGDAAGEVRHIGGIVAVRLFNHDCVAHATHHVFSE